MKTIIVSLLALIPTLAFSSTVKIPDVHCTTAEGSDLKVVTLSTTDAAGNNDVLIQTSSAPEVAAIRVFTLNDINLIGKTTKLSYSTATGLGTAKIGDKLTVVECSLLPRPAR